MEYLVRNLKLGSKITKQCRYWYPAIVCVVLFQDIESVENKTYEVAQRKIKKKKGKKKTVAMA